MDEDIEFDPLDKPKPIAWLIDELDQDVNHEHLSHSKRDEYLEQLKTYTRTATEAAPLCTTQGVLLLCRHGFDHGTAKTSRTALKCLANVMLLNEKTRQMFVELEYPARCARLFEHDNRDDEFLAARILFLLTYGTTYDFNGIFEEKNLLETLNVNLNRHARFFQTATQRRRTSTTVGDAASPGYIPVDEKAIEATEQAASLALGETLKLMFNLATFYPSIKPKIASSLEPILKLLHAIKLHSPPLRPPMMYLINALLCLDFEGQKSILFPTLDAKSHVDRLLEILDMALARQSEGDLERVGNPTVTLLRKIYEMAPKGIKVHMRATMLPSDKDREKPLGKSESLSSRLLRASSSVAAPTLAKGVQEMLFELSGKDAQRFVRNIGLGFAAGFLHTHNMPVPESATDAWSIRDSSRVTELDDDDNDDDDDYDDYGDEKADGKASSVGKVSGRKMSTSTATTTSTASTRKSPPPSSGSSARIPINPITGQRRDMEESDEEDPRTEAEKMREAERLFVLFERLKATGVVNVENPVAKAVREGRME